MTTYTEQDIFTMATILRNYMVTVEKGIIKEYQMKSLIDYTKTVHLKLKSVQKILSTPFDQLPLHINDTNIEAKLTTQWRLLIGR